MIISQKPITVTLIMSVLKSSLIYYFALWNIVNVCAEVNFNMTLKLIIKRHNQDSGKFKKKATAEEDGTLKKIFKMF